MSNTPAQCDNCHMFCNLSLHCVFDSRCVKCSRSHKTKDYKKIWEEKPKCINCEGGHAAKYKKCPAIVQEITTRRPTRFHSMKSHVSAQKSTDFSSPLSSGSTFKTTHQPALSTQKKNSKRKRQSETNC